MIEVLGGCMNLGVLVGKVLGLTGTCGLHLSMDEGQGRYISCWRKAGTANTVYHVYYICNKMQSVELYTIKEMSRV